MQGWDVLEDSGELTRRGEPFALATVVWRQGPSSGQQGARACSTNPRRRCGFCRASTGAVKSIVRTDNHKEHEGHRGHKAE